MSRCLHILLNFIHLFNARRLIKKISQIRLSYSRSLYIVFLYGIAKVAMLDKIIYSWEEMNLIKKVVVEIR